MQQEVGGTGLLVQTFADIQQNSNGTLSILGIRLEKHACQHMEHLAHLRNTLLNLRQQGQVPEQPSSCLSYAGITGRQEVTHRLCGTKLEGKHSSGGICTRTVTTSIR